MKLQVNSTNEFTFCPDVSDNLQKPEGERFAIILKKVNRTLQSNKWASFDAEGGININMAEKIRAQIVKLVRPPILLIDGKEEREMTVDDLLGDTFPALFPIVEQLVEEINKLETDSEDSIKKS